MIGTNSGGLFVYDVSSNKSVYSNECAHDEEVTCMAYGQGRVWTSGGDYCVKVWICNDFVRETQSKSGYIYKLSPKSSKVRWLSFMDISF